MLLVDLRDNYGGSPYYWKEFLLPMLIGGHFQSTYYYFVKDESYEKYVNYDFKGFMDSTISDFKHLDIVLANERDREAFRNLCTNYQKCYVYHESLQTVSKKYDKSLQFHGKIYFLVNQNSASATDALARFIKANHIGTLAGSPTHGTGNEMVYTTTFPKTQYMIRSIISRSWGKGMSLEQSCRVDPDIFVPNSEVQIFNDHGTAMCSNDQVIQKVLELEGIQN